MRSEQTIPESSLARCDIATTRIHPTIPTLMRVESTRKVSRIDRYEIARIELKFVRKFFSNYYHISCLRLNFWTSPET